MTILVRAARRPTLFVFCVVYAALALWALATPLWASPDEPAHVVRAYSAVHGQVYVTPVAAVAGTGGYVTVPRGLADGAKACYALDPRVDAACLTRIADNHRPVTVHNGAARYNPLYYLVVGLPSLFGPLAAAPMAMRLVSAALSAWLLAWALTSAALSSRPRLAVATVLFGITPMVLFLGAVVNPNGTEIAAAAATWVNGLLLLRNDDAALRPLLLRRTAVSASVLVLLRGLSPLWLAVIAVVALVAAAPGLRRRLFRRDVRPWATLVVTCCAAAVAWTVLSGSLRISQLRHPHHWSWGKRLAIVSRGLASRSRQQLGVFGWLDTPLPRVDYLWWTLLAIAVALLALALMRWRDRLALVLIAAIIVGLPLLLEAANFNAEGAVWQGRYTLPISIGAAAVAAVGLGTVRRLWQPLEWTLVAALAAGFAVINVIAFAWALHRYVSGLAVPFTLSGAWQPPGGALTLVVLFAVVVGFGSVAALSVPERLVRRQPVAEPGREPAAMPAGAPGE